MAERQAGVSRPPDPDRADREHLHQLRRPARYVPQRFAGRFREAAQSWKHEISCANGWTARSCWWAAIRWTTVRARRSSRCFSGTKWLTPGVEIHANTIRTLLERSYLLQAPQWVLALALLLATSRHGLDHDVAAAGPAVALDADRDRRRFWFHSSAVRRRPILSTSEILLATSICWLCPWSIASRPTERAAICSIGRSRCLWASNGDVAG